MSNDKWIWVIRKENGEAIRIVDVDFDPELYELQDEAEAGKVQKAVGDKKAAESEAQANAEKIEKNAAARKSRRAQS